jgi:hypothetical protein
MVDEYADMMEQAMVGEAERVYEGVPFAVDKVVGRTWWDAKEA